MTGTRAGGEPASLALEIDHVCASYGPYRALFDVTFAVPSGGVTALLGSNGAGKSTTSRVITGLLPSTSGRILLYGQEITGPSVSTSSETGLATESMS